MDSSECSPPTVIVTNMNAEPVVRELRRVADLLEKGLAGFISGGILITDRVDGCVEISSDLKVLPMGGTKEPTIFVTEFLRLTDEGPELVRYPTSDWPSWANSFKHTLGM